jgi:type 2 lantibiotic biosynthesis protein LanM
MTEWNWQQATTLVERAGWRRSARAEYSTPERVTDRGRKRLAKWRSQPPFDSDEWFQRRLFQVGLTEPEFLELLSRPVGGPPGVKPPAWAIQVCNALADASNGESCVSTERTLAKPQNQLLELVRPLIARWVTRLREEIRSLKASSATQSFEPDTAEEIFVNLLHDRLLPIVARTMTLELNVARLQGLLRGERSEERFQSFIDRIKRPEVRRELLSEYPVLGRLAVTSLDQWLSGSLEFLERWSADWPLICGALCPGESPGPLASIDGDAGDGHHGGRAVWIVRCRSGFRVVYKPKAIAVERHFQEVLQWLNDRGASPPFRTLRVLDRGCYGWEEFVAPQGCRSAEEVTRFYERIGSYLAILYALSAADFHHENLIAAGEHPVLIDLEALFHPSGFEVASRSADDIAGQSFVDSVLGSGLLPVPRWSEHNAGASDISGVGADACRQLPTLVPGWKDPGTDQMRFVRNSAVTHSSDHRARLNESVTDPLDYLDAIERGFRKTYWLLENHRQELLVPGGVLERFANDEVRVVLRNTSTYGDLLQDGSHPDVMRDGLDRDRLFDRLWDEVRERPGLAQLIPAEIEDLWRGDIPLFTTRPKSRDLSAGAGRDFEEVLDESGLECAKRRLDQFGAPDLGRQLWFLRGSLTTLASHTRTPAHRRRSPLIESETACGCDEFLAAARAVGDRLEATAFRHDKEIAWIGLRPMREKQWLLVPLGLDFYDGIPGIGLFLAYLGAVSGEERYTSLARATLSVIRHRLRPDRRQKGLSELGGFTGWGGVLYTLAHLAEIWNEPEILAEARAMAEVLPRRFAKDQDLDIIGGAAGCIAGLLCLHACSPSGFLLEAAHQCGEHLLAHTRQMPTGLGWTPRADTNTPLAGFSHGAAGISWALLELAARTGEDRFRTAAQGGIAYERSLFSPQAGNWLDLRIPGTDLGQSARDSHRFTVAWCHGAPGIGLARLRCRPFLDDPLVDSEIETALRTTVASGFGHNHSLCHGDLGNLELLLEAGTTWPRSAWTADANRFGADILRSIRTGGWVCGNPLAVESPGLMTGIAGIGYGMLRCAEPSRVPSVLSLAPPILHAAADDRIVRQCGDKTAV